MTEKYTPLKQSHLWQDMERSAEQYWLISPTKLGVLADCLCEFGNRYEWSKGQLIYIKNDEMYDSLEYTGRFNASATAGNDPSEHPLFSAIPSIPAQDFLKYSSDNAFEYAPNERIRLGKLSLTEGYSHCLRMPENVDVHTLAAIMLLMKHVLIHPDRIHGSNSEKQAVLVRQVMNVGFAIIEKSSIEENFSKSCAEFEKNLPELTIFDKRYLEHADEQYQVHLDIKTMSERMTPEQAKKVGIELGFIKNPDKKTPPPGPST